MDVETSLILGFCNILMSWYYCFYKDKRIWIHYRYKDMCPMMGLQINTLFSSLPITFDAYHLYFDHLISQIPLILNHTYDKVSKLIIMQFLLI